MIINGESLFLAAPIKNMLGHKAKAHGVSHGLTEAGYDIRIKQEVWFKPSDGVVFIRDVQVECEEAVVEGIAFERVKYTYPNSSVQDGNFTLASAMEEFQMPNNLMGVVHDKSTWARRRLSVFNTVIEPGWNGFLTLELVYHGREELRIPAGAGIAQVIFHELKEPRRYSGKYQNQADMPVAARES